MKPRATSAPARCVLRDDGELGCSTVRWQDRLTLSTRLLREARRNVDLADLFRRLAEEHERRLPRSVRVGFELATAVASAELGVELSALSRCAISPPSWSRASTRQRRRPDRNCRLYTFAGFSEEL